MFDEWSARGKVQVLAANPWPDVKVFAVIGNTNITRGEVKRGFKTSESDL